MPVGDGEFGTWGRVSTIGCFVVESSLACSVVVDCDTVCGVVDSEVGGVMREES